MARRSASSLKPPNDLDDVRRKLGQLAEEGRTSDLIELVLQMLAQMSETNNALSLRLQTALRELYGRKSQKISAAQLSLLFAELGPEASAQPERELVPQPPEPPKPPSPRGGRSPRPPHLERKQRRVTVPASERVCPRCGKDKACIGYRTSEVLDFVPAHFVVIEEQREKLACPRCPEQGVATAPSDKVMDRGRPGAGLLAKLLVDKFEDSLPLYRQAQQCACAGVPLAASTLGDWSSFALDVLAPVAARITERVLSAFYVRADDTGMPVQDRDHPRGIKRGHLWSFIGADLAAFLYAPDWKAKYPAALLDGFQGFLQGDGYAGYDAMLRSDRSGEPILSEDRRLGCAMHLRAKFEKAAKLHDARAAIALSYFQALYRIEAACKAEVFSPQDRHARRQEQSLPLVDAFYQWVHELHPHLVP
ncbi:putative transposase [Chondromyces apiculatus DSM 436]|uniref:Putative transposase n=1 Tax=Chondromyces apiculatus DSM 436 TaxID=1192034 RepID=A0A017SYF5_9BACT|nr:putative transposase [Chondromyces apiculatus DSM 436]